MATQLKLTINQLSGNEERIKNIDPTRLISPEFGLPTIKYILSELEKPGRDPRPELKTASFKDGIERIQQHIKRNSLYRIRVFTTKIDGLQTTTELFS